MESNVMVRTWVSDVSIVLDVSKHKQINIFRKFKHTNVIIHNGRDDFYNVEEPLWFSLKGEPGLLVCTVPEISKDLQFYKGGREINEKKVLRNVIKEGDCFFNFGDMLTMDSDYFVYFKDRIGDTFR